MAVATLMAHVMCAEQYEHDIKNLWLGLGRTQPWNNEEEPPDENIDRTDLDQFMGAKEVTRGSLVVPIIPNNPETGGKPVPEPDSETIKYKGQQWQPVSDNNALKYGARWLYLEIHIYPEDLPYGVFRQIGVYKDLTPIASAVGKPNLRPQEIANKGYLIAYGNQRFERYDSNVGMDISIVMEF